MAFVPSYSAVDDQTFEINGLDSPDERIARIAIGWDDETMVVYSAVVTLCRIPWEPEDHYELQFDIVEATATETIWHNDGLHTQRFLKEDARLLAIDCLCAATRALATKYKPSAITMVTVTPYLPKKALAKYTHLCNALRDCGYEGGRGNSYNGSEIWMFVAK